VMPAPVVGEISDFTHNHLVMSVIAMFRQLTPP